MIPHAEILALRGEWNLRADVIEKDYMLGWMLAAIAAAPELADTWVFKGGTCLRKCFYETYRFSEDLDFTVVEGGPERPEDLVLIFEGVREWLRDRIGLEIVVDASSFVRRQNRRGNPTTLGRIAYRGPSGPPRLPKIKIDLTSDEVLVGPSVRRPILHTYSDAGEMGGEVLSYSIVELLAEKTRALAERCRPRDLYDVVNIHRHPELLGDPAPVVAALGRKCAHVGIPVPDANTIRGSLFRDELEQEWENMLGHQLPHLPSVADFWDELDTVFDWMAGAPTHPLERAPAASHVDSSWQPPRAMTAWRQGAPLELIRFAGANRLKVEIDYRAVEGRSGRRIVEPYSLRMTQDGSLLLYVVNDRGHLRSYRVDRIAGVRILDESFRPRYLIEF
ncbi:MAG: nucleotidyl transferase AbiEii/AbiGii toxin family protein [Acidimicrobiia bacterium]